ncbi:MAG: catalase [Burkholderiales bacterium]|jgi:hypothetical protein|nr:MAG: catalase [Burkholderiales bacterium]
MPTLTSHLRPSWATPSLQAVCAAALMAALAPASWAATAVATPNADGEVIPADEPAAIAAVTNSIKASVQAGFDKNGHAYRDAHRKAHGCVQARFTVLGKLPAKLAQGLFATPRSYDAVVRFSNGSGSSQDDHSPDGRGMAVKVLGVSGPKLLDDEPNASTQDFLMINHPVFFVRNASDYVAFQKNTVSFLLTHLHEAGIIIAIGAHSMTNPLNARYWSMVPYKLGTEQMKYSARPCAGGTFYDQSNSADRLRENLTGQLASGSACFDFMVQTRTAPADMPIEDPTIEWKEASSPFVPVARIDIPAQTPEGAEACEIRSFTPWHSIAEHRPLGGISRVRKTVYQTISTLRHQLNGQPRVEP